MPANTNTLPTYFLSDIWPIVLGLISAVYCGKSSPIWSAPHANSSTVLSLRAFLRHPLEFTELLAYDRALTRSRCFRLVGLAMVQTLYTTPLAVLVICLNATAQPIAPWLGLAANHRHLSRVDQIPAVEWRQDRAVAVELELARWAAPFCALAFVALFGFAEEAHVQYYKVLKAIVRPLGFLEPNEASASS